MQAIILKILILGGTNFLGPHLVEELHEHGHHVTIFNRGSGNLPFLANVERLYGNRDGDLEALKNRHWDAIIDTSGHLPRLVEDSSKILAQATEHYTFISTIGVYENFHAMRIDESYPLAKIVDRTNEEITDKTYGALKAACENVIEKYFPTSLIVRPGLIVGPRDPTGRFSYWPLRIAEGGNVLAPGSPMQSVQIIDVRDLAKWIVSMVEKKATGVYNATGNAVSLGYLLKTCLQNTQKDVAFTWVSEDFLIEQGVQDWVELPLWLSSKRNMAGFLNVENQKSIFSGLTFRALSETIADTVDWERKNPDNGPKKGMDRTKEQNLLKLWQRVQ